MKQRIFSLFERGTLAFLVSAITMFLTAVVMALLNPQMSSLLIPRLLALFMSFVLLGVYVFMRSQEARLWIFFLEVLNIVIVATISHEIYLEHMWMILVPYIGIKLAALMGALAAPEIAFPTLAAFGLLILAPFIQALILWTPAERLILGPEEPFITIAFVAVSILIWHYRRNGIELARQKAALAAQNEVFKRFAILLLGAQHLMNSPLQSVAANVRLIETDCPQVRSRIQAIDRAFETVHKVSQLISFGDDYIDWDEKDMPSDLQGFSELVHKMALTMKTDALAINKSNS